ncbi:hypothetical protein [Thiothrix fructosivorans]|uniref:Uncharacterized protein n=1 Tax=Thiothrix fructosivorans TaxID=111770 RepID=A0A8B0SRS4_9GAMM|nr:hypothetical protein [Thiothrix fructosivorans]MBO0612957.1 hypothetical protein [Thiothrix fructosivorans]QTX11592.1 hypothetical protein J1836_004365 [Thiothrix fructosivorans]
MSNPVQRFINDITATGARFVVDAGDVWLDRPIPDDLLEIARQQKEPIRQELEAQRAAIRLNGVELLSMAAQGLPLDFAELLAFFDGDIHDFGSGGVSPAGIRKACEWFAYVYPLRRAAQ